MGRFTTITEKETEYLVKRVRKFYKGDVDVVILVTNLLLETPEISIADAFTILSSGLGKGKPYASGQDEDDLREGPPLLRRGGPKRPPWAR